MAAFDYLPLCMHGDMNLDVARIDLQFSNIGDRLADPHSLIERRA